MTYEEAFKEVMEEFDFEKVVKVMRALDWKYFDGEPDEAMCKEVAYNLYQSAKYEWETDEYHSVSSGGFEWMKRYRGAPLELRFVAEDVDWIGGDDA